jgi:glucokinase
MVARVLRPERRSAEHDEAARRLVWAIDLGGTSTKLGLVEQSGRLLGQRSFSTRSGRGGDSWADEAVAVLRQIAAEAGLTAREVEAVGIGAPGPLNRRDGVLTNPLPNLPGWQGFPICAALTRRTGKPAYLDNDANVAALAEHWLGSGRGVDNIVVLTLGTGIGSGIIADGRLLHGFSDNAGELGHLSINYRGPKCVCGNRGCIELYASGPALVRRFRRRLRAGEGRLKGRRDITPRDIFEAARRGDAAARDSFAEVGRYLGMAIASIVHALNPELVVIAGGLAGAAEFILEPATEVVRQRTYPDLQVGLRIEASHLGETLGLLGAARLALTSRR